MKINQILGLKQKTLEANEASRVKNQKKKWSWWDSNPRPNIFAVNFLHAYFGIDCRKKCRNQTNQHLS